MAWYRRNRLGPRWLDVPVWWLWAVAVTAVIVLVVLAPGTMSEALKIVLTAALTLAGGILVLTVSQTAQKFLFEPLHEQATVIGEIAFALVRWARVYTNPREHPREQTDEADRACEGFRDLAARLAATTHGVRWYRWATKLGAPPIDDVVEAMHHLILISNNIYYPPGSADPKRAEDNLQAARAIRMLLAIMIPI